MSLDAYIDNNIFIEIEQKNISKENLVSNIDPNICRLPQK